MVSELVLPSHSSHSVCVSYTPSVTTALSPPRISNSLKQQKFYVLFSTVCLGEEEEEEEEIAVICQAQTCQWNLQCTPTLHFDDCVIGSMYEKIVEISNQVGFRIHYLIVV